ncbi:hypothetical protein SNE32_10385, partial [Lysobacter sp. D1-1-M9]
GGRRIDGDADSGAQPGAKADGDAGKPSATPRAARPSAGKPTEVTANRAKKPAANAPKASADAKPPGLLSRIRRRLESVVKRDPRSPG